MDGQDLKQKIREGKSIRSTGVAITATRQDLEAAAKNDPDVFNVDCQHGPYSEIHIMELCLIAKDLDVPVGIRIKHNRLSFLIGVMLDLGPLMITVPQVEDEETVDEALNAFYYSPVGKRGWGGTAPTRYGLEGHEDQDAYVEYWNTHGVLTFQLESVNGITNARHLAKPGVDALLFGPNDLKLDLKRYPHHPFQTAEACITHVKEQMAGSDVRVGLS